MTLEIEIEPQVPRPDPKLLDPLLYILQCSETELDNFELGKLNEIRNLESHEREVRKMIFETGNVIAMIRMVRMRGREDFRKDLESPPPDPIVKAKADIRKLSLASGETRKVPALPHGEANRNSSKKYQATHTAIGLCTKCPSPRARHSVSQCERHLAADSERKRRKKLPPTAAALVREPVHAGTNDHMVGNGREVRL